MPKKCEILNFIPLKNVKIQIPDKNGLFFPCLFKPGLIKVCLESEKAKTQRLLGLRLEFKVQNLLQLKILYKY
jgi:hypothetical protein